MPHWTPILRIRLGLLHTSFIVPNDLCIRFVVSFKVEKYVHSMSAQGYLQDTSLRPLPPPLRLQHPAKRTSTIVSPTTSPEYQTLLYDLPSTAPLSPPLAPKGEAVSPTLSSFSGRPANWRPASGRASPHPRSATPSRVQVDLEAFAERCRKW